MAGVRPMDLTNAQNNQNTQLEELVQNFYDFAKKTLPLDQDPLIMYDYEPQQELNPIKQSTGMFNPENNSIILFCFGRGAKDILRTLAHELIHFRQHCGGEITPELQQKLLLGADIEDQDVENIEGSAYRDGNLLLRKFSLMQENIFSNKQKDSVSNAFQQKTQRIDKKFEKLNELKEQIQVRNKGRRAEPNHEKVLEFDNIFQTVFTTLFEKYGFELMNYYEPGYFYEYQFSSQKSDQSVTFSIFPCGDESIEEQNYDIVLSVAYMANNEKNILNFGKSEAGDGKPAIKDFYSLYIKIKNLFTERK